MTGLINADLMLEFLSSDIHKKCRWIYRIGSFSEI